jgi:transcriptional regulator with XRE-family HTH domain
MNPEQAKALGRFLREHRAALGLSTHQLAARGAIDQATVVRLEKGAFAEPRPETLRVVAEALGVNLADVFGLAGYAVPGDLPSFQPYLRTKYRGLPAEAVDQLDRAFQRLAKRHGLDAAGPAPGEDEQPEEQPTKSRKGGRHAPTQQQPRSKPRRA